MKLEVINLKPLGGQFYQTLNMSCHKPQNLSEGTLGQPCYRMNDFMLDLKAMSLTT